MDLIGEAAHLGRLEGALSETPVRFDGLEGLLAPGSGAAATAGSLVVVCHPHPHYGGNMRNNVVAAVCGGLARAGVATLRFDLRRGADDGDALLAANAADVGAAVAFARSRGYGRVGLVAYSWSTLAAARHLAGAEAPAALALVAPPVHADGAGNAAAPFLDFLDETAVARAAGIAAALQDHDATAAPRRSLWPGQGRPRRSRAEPGELGARARGSARCRVRVREASSTQRSEARFRFTSMLKAYLNRSTKKLDLAEEEAARRLAQAQAPVAAGPVSYAPRPPGAKSSSSGAAGQQARRLRQRGRQAAGAVRPTTALSSEQPPTCQGPPRS